MSTQEEATRAFINDISEELIGWAQRVLASAGERLMEKSVATLEAAGKNATGDLIGSMGYATSDKEGYHSPDPKWKLTQPTDRLLLRYGTTCPYAQYTRAGSPPAAKGSTGGGWEAVYKWGLTKGFSDEDAKGYAHAVMKYGTELWRTGGEINFFPSTSEVFKEISLARRREPVKVGRKIVRRQFVVDVVAGGKK